MKEQPAAAQPVIDNVQPESGVRPLEAKELLAKGLKRRGLFAAALGLGAAAVSRAAGFGRTEASTGDYLVLGNMFVTLYGDAGQTANAGTKLVAGAAFDGSNSPYVFSVDASAATNYSITGINAIGHGPNASGLEASGGNGANLGYGVSALGGNGAFGSDGSPGVYSTGGLPSGGGTGGPGVLGVGGFSALGLGGPGVRGVGLKNATGIKGVSSATNDFGPGGDGSGSGIGVHGRSSTGYGVKGEGIGATGIGVGGFTAGSGDGVFGASASGKGVHGQSSGLGVYGVSLGNTPGGSAGVFGGSETAIGVEGYSGTTAAVHGFSSGAAGTGIGVYGFSTQHLGVLAESNNYIGLYAVSKTAFNPAVYGYSSFVGAGRTAGRFDGDVVVNGNFTVAGGAKAAAVTLPDGSVRMMYCQESPEPYFEDFGGGVLTGGSTRVNLEPAFASLVKLDGYRVFLTAEGDSRGLYVSAKDATGFDVREQQAGQSNVGFSYRVVAKRKDIPGDRLAQVSPQAAKAIAVPATLPKVDIAPQQVPNITPAQPVAPGANGPQTPFVPAGPKGR